MTNTSFARPLKDSHALCPLYLNAFNTNLNTMFGLVFTMDSENTYILKETLSFDKVLLIDSNYN